MSMARENGAKYKREKGENRMKFSRHGKAFPWMIRAYETASIFTLSLLCCPLTEYAFPLWTKEKVWTEGKDNCAFRQGLVVKRGELHPFLLFLSEIKIIDTIGKSPRNVRSLRDFHLCADFSFKNYTRNEVLAVKERERVDVQGGEISQK